MRKINIADKELEITDDAYDTFICMFVNKKEDNASKYCFYFNYNNHIVYINPYNKEQIMYYHNGIHINVSSFYVDYGSRNKQKMVWRKVKTTDNLKKGDLIKGMNSITDFVCSDDIGVITDIDYSTRQITTQSFVEEGIYWNKFLFEYYTKIYKAVYLGNDYE